MNKYADWADDNLAVTSLLLDPQNPQLSELGHEPTQREIVAELVKHEALYELTRDISAQGFFPTETLVCVREGDALIAVEGNRRLASLKLLLSPELAPPDDRSAAAFMKQKHPFSWVMSYDKVPEIKKLYRDLRQVGLSLSYSASFSCSEKYARSNAGTKHLGKHSPGQSFPEEEKS